MKSEIYIVLFLLAGVASCARSGAVVPAIMLRGVDSGLTLSKIEYTCHALDSSTGDIVEPTEYGTRYTYEDDRVIHRFDLTKFFGKEHTMPLDTAAGRMSFGANIVLTWQAGVPDTVSILGSALIYQGKLFDPGEEYMSFMMSVLPSFLWKQIGL